MYHKLSEIASKRRRGAGGIHTIGPQNPYEPRKPVQGAFRERQSGTEYYLVATDDLYAGYMGLVPDHQNRKMMISKLYVRREARGTGIGGLLLDYVIKECGKREIDTIWLTVNRFNHAPIEWYRRKGFSVIDEVKKDIGEGFYMDDFIMEKKLIDRMD